MPANYVLLEKVVVGAAGAASVKFNSIPQSGYTDLVMKVSSRSARSATGTDWKIEFNGSTTGYSYRRIYGDGAAVYSDTASTGQSFTDSSANSTANTFGNAEIYIPNYTSSNYKSWSADSVSENNASGANSAYQNLYADLWSNTAAITSIEIKPVQSTTFAQYSTFSLYGIAAVGTTPAIAPKATGGDIIQTDGTYWYHAFLSSGTFTPALPLTCDYLVVAGGGGGGGGGGDAGGGGGAGGLRSTVTATGGGGSLESALSLSATGYTVTIGAGGTRGLTTTSTFSTNGSDSTFSTITSTGGGRGAGYRNTGGSYAATSGGSGGGGRNATYPNGSGTTNQGYAGGAGSDSNVTYAGGGGGGAGAVGGNGVSSTGIAGSGGAGVAISALATITGTGVSTYYAGGGGGSANAGSPTGGAGGAGGGGTGATGTATAGTAATANTGSGGGGGSTAGGGNGASGIVIIRYPIA